MELSKNDTELGGDVTGESSLNDLFPGAFLL